MAQLTIDEAMRIAVGYHQAGRWVEAERVYRRVLAQAPDQADALHLLGVLSCQSGHIGAAIDLIGRAITINPAVSEYHSNLGESWRRAGQREWAIASCRRAIELKPDRAEAHNSLGNALRENGRLELAIAACNRAIELKPDLAEAYNNLGIALQDQGRHDEAIAAYTRAIALRPDLAKADNNLDPWYAEAHKNLGLVLLQMGDFEQGWSQIEWRWRTKDETFKPRNFPQPLWDGRPLEGRSLLVHAEQGLGDTLQFIRYVPLVRERGCRVIVECQKPLQLLLSSCPGIDQLVARGEELPPFDFHVPLLSLPRLLGTNAGNIPADVPYLLAREELVRHWQDRLSDCAGLRIGIAWQGSPAHRRDRQRSFALAQFAALAEMPGVHLISLQKGIGAEQLAAVRFPVKVLGADLDEAHGAFMDTAAVMRNLDLIIAADTAVAHLAGALGLAVWVVQTRVPDWRWLLGREDSPWYPTMRLFRQENAGDWEPVFRRIQEALRERLSAHPGASQQGGAAAPPSPQSIRA